MSSLPSPPVIMHHCEIYTHTCVSSYKKEDALCRLFFGSFFVPYFPFFLLPFLVRFGGRPARFTSPNRRKVLKKKKKTIEVLQPSWAISPAQSSNRVRRERDPILFLFFCLTLRYCFIALAALLGTLMIGLTFTSVLMLMSVPMRVRTFCGAHLCARCAHCARFFYFFSPPRQQFLRRYKNRELPFSAPFGCAPEVCTGT